MEALDEGARTRAWGALLEEVCGRADSVALSDADWGRVLDRIAVDASLAAARQEGGAR